MVPFISFPWPRAEPWAQLSGHPGQHRCPTPRAWGPREEALRAPGTGPGPPLLSRPFPLTARQDCTPPGLKPKGLRSLPITCSHPRPAGSPCKPVQSLEQIKHGPTQGLCTIPPPGQSFPSIPPFLGALPSSPPSSRRPPLAPSLKGPSLISLSLAGLMVLHRRKCETGISRDL